MKPEVSESSEVARAYDAMAESYDAVDAQPFYANQYATYARDLRRRSGLWRGTVLDLGCGTAIHTVEASRTAAYVVGVDISWRLLVKAKDKLDGRRGCVVLADADALPFAGDRFDAALSYGEPLSHVDDPDAVVCELARVVRPGATIVISVDNEWNLRTFIRPRRLWRALTTRGGSTRRWSFYDDAGRSVELELGTFTHGGLSRLLARHGFSIVDTVGIHVFTLLAPLETEARERGWKALLFDRLHRLDRLFSRHRPFNRFGYSKIVAARRGSDDDVASAGSRSERAVHEPTLDQGRHEARLG